MTLTEGDVKAMKVSELKKNLTQRGIPTNGVKSKLQQRLLEAIKSEAATAAAAAATKSTGMDDDTPNEGTIDESTRYKGTVFKYEYRRGFGLISPEGEEDAKKKVYVHWKQIQSSDDWPALTKDMEVEYYLGTRKKLIRRGGKLQEKGEQTFAANVTLVGGEPVSVSQEDLGKTFPDRETRFQGTVKFFRARDGFGFIKPTSDIDFHECKVSAGDPKIYVAREDIKSTESTCPSLKNDVEVEFTLYKRKNATQWGAGDVTLPGGAPVTEEQFGKMGPKRKFNQGFGKFRGKGRPMGGGMMAVPMMGMGGGGGGGQMMMMPMNMMQMMMGGGGFKKNWGGKKWGNKGKKGGKSKTNFSW